MGPSFTKQPNRAVMENNPKMAILSLKKKKKKKIHILSFLGHDTRTKSITSPLHPQNTKIDRFSVFTLTPPSQNRSFLTLLLLKKKKKKFSLRPTDQPPPHFTSLSLHKFGFDLPQHSK